MSNKPCLEFWRSSATQTTLKTWERENPHLEWQSRGRTHLIKHGSEVQRITALSSDESDYHALLRSSVHALGIKALLNDWHYGVKCEIHMRCDSSAARGMSARQELGTSMLAYVSCGYNKQQRKCSVSPPSENLSDTFTKSVPSDADRCYLCMNFHVVNVGSGRHRKLEST